MFNECSLRQGKDESPQERQAVDTGLFRSSHINHRLRGINPSNRVHKFIFIVCLFLNNWSSPPITLWMQSVDKFSWLNEYPIPVYALLQSIYHSSVVINYSKGHWIKQKVTTKKAPQQNLIISHIDLRPPTTPTVRSHYPHNDFLHMWSTTVDIILHHARRLWPTLNLTCVRPFSVDKRSRSIQPRFREIKYRQEAKHGFHDWWRWRDTSLLLLIIPHRNGTFQSIFNHDSWTISTVIAVAPSGFN